jgi:succinate-semialdehyde dehydrogenase / glutarate-semialdehyde dehydrogenase
VAYCGMQIYQGTAQSDSLASRGARVPEPGYLCIHRRAPFVVFDDSDIEMAVKGAIASKFCNAGQTCVCANRILVQDGVYDAFTQRLAETAGAMKVADGFEPGAVIEPLIDMKAVEKVEAHIADALKKGAKIVTGGKRAAQGGSFFEPTVLTDVTTDMAITKEETFGPVAPLYRFKTDAEAIKMANGEGLPGSWRRTK